MITHRQEFKGKPTMNQMFPGAEITEGKSGKYLIFPAFPVVVILFIFFNRSRLFQNPVGFETTSWKSGQMPAFPLKSKVAVPKTEVLEQPQLLFDKRGGYEEIFSFVQFGKTLF
jgi:hypothetical protein